VDRLTGLFIILATLLVRSVEWSVRWKVVDPNILIAWIYDYAPMIAICGWNSIAVLELVLGGF